MKSGKRQTGVAVSRGRRNWIRFKRNRRGYYSLLIFLTLFVVSIFAELVSNDVPLVVRFEGEYFFPVFKSYSETTFGGDFETEADYKDPIFEELLQGPGDYMIFPPIQHDFNSINFEIEGPVPSPPTGNNLLGTDDRGRDVMARIIYGFRLSVLFGLALTLLGTVTGIIAGAIQGFLGGRVDLVFQRFIEIWGAMPELYLLIIFASIFQPSVLLLLILLSLFSWMGLFD